MRKIKIGFLASNNPQDKKAWSGLIYQFYKNLSEEYEIVWIPVKRSFWGQRYMKIIKIRGKISGKSFTPHFTYPARQMAKKVNQKLLDSVDLIFAPAASSCVAYLKTNKPIIYLSDTAFSLMINYYYFNLSNFNIREGNKIEQLAASRSTHIIVSSDWAKKAYVEYYSVSEEKVSVIEFGANIDRIELVNNTDNKTGRSLNILFLGVEWERKGGDVAVECVKILNESGIKAYLYIVGTDTPHEYSGLDFIQSIGFLNKNKDSEYRQLKEIISKSDVLLLPTGAECAGVAFSEASAYKLPVFTYDTGGIANYVVNGKNGYRLPLSATSNDFACKIKECMEQNELPALRKGCEDIYNKKLNWNVWTEKVRAIIDSSL
jgi:glycosyltransferase involved in cell wall biosynthesis